MRSGLAGQQLGHDVAEVLPHVGAPDSCRVEIYVLQHRGQTDKASIPFVRRSECLFVGSNVRNPRLLVNLLE